MTSGLPATSAELESEPTSNPRVLVVGDANLDLVLRGDVRPRFGQTEQLLDSADLTLGGSGSLVAHGLARLGTEVALCAAIGADTFGQRTREFLYDASVDVAPMVVREQIPTGLTVILSDGDRAILTHLGAIATLRREEVPALHAYTHLHVASVYLGEGLRPALPELLRSAHELGLTTSVDTNDDPARTWLGIAELLATADVALPNDAEVIAWAKALGMPHATWVEAAEGISELGAMLVVKCGAEGGAVFEGGAEVARLAPPPTVPVDTTGAGDSFDAGWIHARVCGADVEASLRAAVHAGALSTRSAGGAPSQATRAELDASLDRLDQPD